MSNPLSPWTLGSDVALTLPFLAIAPSFPYYWTVSPPPNRPCLRYSHQAHEDSRALRDALMEVDEQNMQLYEQSNGLRRHAAAVLKENDALRQEIAQLRGLLTGAASGAAASSASLAAASAAAAVAASTTASTAAVVAASETGAAPHRRGRSHHGTKSAGGGAVATSGTAVRSESGTRVSGTLPLGSKDYHLVPGGGTGVVAAASTPPRPPLSNAGAAPVVATLGAAVSIPTAPLSISLCGRKSDGGLTGATVRASVRRPVGYATGMEGLSYGLHVPPLPPTRGSAGRPKSTTRSANVLSGGRPLGASINVQASGEHICSSLDGAVGKASSMSSMGIGGGERAHRVKPLMEALSAEGAVVVVHATRRVGGSGAAIPTQPSRSRSTELGLREGGYMMNFVTDAGLLKVGGTGMSSASKVGPISEAGGDESSNGLDMAVRHPPVQVRMPQSSSSVV